MGNVVFDGD